MRWSDALASWAGEDHRPIFAARYGAAPHFRSRRLIRAEKRELGLEEALSRAGVETSNMPLGRLTDSTAPREDCGLPQHLVGKGMSPTS